MKELSIEEKAKRYDEAIKKAESLYKAAEPMSGCNVLLETVFPELKESEDEKIRKWLIEQLKQGLATAPKDVNPNDAEKAIVWLEKQGEKKSIDDLTQQEAMDIAVAKCFEQGEQKPAWSEEDEVKINRIVACLENLNVADNDILLKDVNWLKSLKDRVVPQKPAEWSKEGEEMLTSIIDDTVQENQLDKKQIDWLKSLRPQNKWKPSEEQIKALDSVLENRSFQRRFLESLLEQLKKL